MKKKTKSTSTTNQTTHTVQTPNNPAWVDTLGQTIGGQIGGLSKIDPYSLVAGPDALQTQAGQSAAGLTTSPAFGEVAGAPAQHIGEQNIADYISRFESPYTDKVVNATLAGFDQNAGRTRAQQQLDLAGDTTFGGSGGSILRSLTEGELGRGRALTEAQLRDQGFQTALGAATTQAGMNQGSSLANASLAEQALARKLAATSAAGDETRANIGTQATLGDILRQIAQTRATAPLSLLGTQATLFGGLPLGLWNGQSQDGTMNGTTTSKTTVSDPMGSIGGLLAGAGSLATGLGSLGLGFGAARGLAGSAASGTMGAIVSDRRLKRDVVKLGERPDGLGVYAYRYLWSPVRHVGVMAQEVLRIMPEAVLTMPNGYLAVDYGKL